MGKRNKSRSVKKAIKHKHRQKNLKHINAPRKSKKAPNLLPAASTCQASEAATGLAISTAFPVSTTLHHINLKNNTKDSSRMAPQHQPFQKIKDQNVKKRVKRLNNKKKKNKITYTQKLANSLKRRALISPKNSSACGTKRKLNFKNAVELEIQQQQQLPKPKFYLNKKAGGSKMRMNETIEDGEIIEEIVSSDEDDCIVLDAVVEQVDVEEDSSDNETASRQSNTDLNDNIPTSSRFVVDRIGEYGLSWSTNNGFSYPIRNTDYKSNDNKCIIIDDSFETSSSPMKSVEDHKPNNLMDDSVIFIQDCKSEEDFIPLPADEKPVLKRVKKGKDVKAEPTPKIMRRMNESLFTTTERKKLDNYNSNTYNPGTKVSSTADSNKRPIIIDGSNVAFGHGCSNIFSAEGIKYCVEYFQKMGHDVKAVIPLFRRNPHKSSNPALLDQLHKDNKIVFTPCKNLPNQQSISYDDRFILQLAYERNAAVVSNDNYRDLIHENPAFKKIIENRVIGYSWCDDILILPKDPYGRFGPPLDEILRC
ncbi:NEDD4-binding protein 1 isoform X2 [Drosophila innubila]|uniref:NEDD4-binding protein 1 isoform X2 n=1 Tax=Drosophila innubila TaxID=198719 RepID=UPI00148D9D75|nr:NEDD4-binding protein 1 isoform X2 [Drosophila innubila]